MSPRRLLLPGRVTSFILSRALVAVVVCLGAARVEAQNFLIGIAAGPDRGRVDCVASFPCDRASTQFKLSGAWNFADSWDAQIAYFRAGKFQGGDLIPSGGEFGGTFRVDGVGLTAGYRWTFTPGWSVVTRLGAASMRTRFEYANALAGDASETTLQPLAGVGLAYEVTPSVRIGIDYDVTRFKVYRTRGSLRMLGVAAQFSF